MEEVLLVNEQDKVIGVMEKLEAHRKGLLHRALSVFIFNSSQELLLQKRAINKYHSAGLWTNTCCSHPRPEEEIISAAHRRLWEEMAIKCKLIPAFTFTYKASFDNGLIEYEYDHIFIGKTDNKPQLNKEEAEAWKYMTFDNIKKDTILNPTCYTEWFKLSYEKVFTQLSYL